MTRTISLPAINRTVTLGQFVEAVKMAKANPDREFKQGFDCWWSCTGKEVMAQFRRGMNDRINQAVPYMERGQ